MMASIRSFVGVLCAALVVTACGSPPAQAQSWQVIEQPGGYKVARVTTGGGNGLIQGIGLTCERKVPMIALSLARAPARNPALLSLSDGKSTGTLGVVRNGKTNIWAGPVRDARVLDMLARAANVEVAIDGVGYGTVSLAGASNAMRGALGGCWAGDVAGQAVASAQTLPPTRTGGSTLEAGIYAPTGFECSGLSWTATFPAPGYGEGDSEFIPEVIEAGERFSKSDFPKRRITSATGFVDGTTKFVRCPDSQVPLNARIWPESRYKQVGGLPIKLGLYRTYSDGKPTPITGDGRCGVTGYVRFTSTGYDWIAISNILDRNGYPTKKTENVRESRRLPVTRQIGDRAYDSPYRDGVEGTGEPWLVEAPDNFTKSEGECGEIQFRPVDPRTVPPGLMPR